MENLDVVVLKGNYLDLRGLDLALKKGLPISFQFGLRINIHIYIYMYI